MSTGSPMPLVLLPSGAAGEACLEVVRVWSRHGLLRRTLWIRPGDVQPGQFDLPVAEGLIVDGDDAVWVDVMASLAMTKMVRRTFVVLRFLDGDQRDDEAQNRAAMALLELLGAANPLGLDPARAPIDVRQFNVIAAPTGMGGVSPGSLVSPQFSANFVVSPENRRAADQMDMLVRPGPGQVSWAVAQTATIAGLWTGQTADMWSATHFAGDLESAALGQGQIVPVRSFVRFVSSAPTARDALATVMAQMTDGRRNVVGSSLVTPTNDPESIISQVLVAFDGVEGGRINYEKPAAQPEPERSESGSTSAFKAFFRFSAYEIRLVPRVLWQRFAARMSGTLTKQLAGDEGHQIVTFKGLGPDERRYKEEFERQAVETERELADLDVGLPPAAPELWRTIRETSFGLLDGSDVPDPVPPPILRGQRVVLPSPVNVVGPPQPWVPEDAAIAALPDGIPPDRLVVPSCSPRDATRAAELLATALAQVQADSGSGGLPPSDSEESEGASGSESDLEPDDPTWSEAQATESWSDHSPVEASLDDAVGESVPPVGESGEDRESEPAEVLQEAQASLQVWVNRRRGGLLWRLAERIDHRSAEAANDKEAFRREAVDVPQVDEREPVRARNRFVNLFMLINGLAIVLGYLLWRFGEGIESFTNLPQWFFWGLLVIIFLVAHVQLLLYYYRRRSRFLRRLQTLAHLQRDSKRRALESAYAAAALDGVYEQFVEWGELLGYAIHEPWSIAAGGARDAELSDLAATLPACLDVAVPDRDDGRGELLLRQAAQSALAGAGWRARTYHNLVDLFLADRYVEESDRDYMLLDLDAPAAPNGSRAALLQALHEGGLQERLARQTIQRESADLYQEGETMRLHRVRPVHEVVRASGAGSLEGTADDVGETPDWTSYLDGACLGETEFGLRLWSDSGLMRPTRGAIATFIWRSGNLPHGTPASAAPMAAAAPHENRGVELVARLDIGLPVEAEVLRLFGESLLWDVPTDTDEEQLDTTDSGRGEFV